VILAREAVRPIFEEAYSFAMLMLEGRRKIQLPIQIFATDLDEGALATARERRYPPGSKPMYRGTA
jgi:chemotaxis methyl-accepting protein methylase